MKFLGVYFASPLPPPYPAWDEKERALFVFSRRLMSLKISFGYRRHLEKEKDIEEGRFARSLFNDVSNQLYAFFDWSLFFVSRSFLTSFFDALLARSPAHAFARSNSPLF